MLLLIAIRSAIDNIRADIHIRILPYFLFCVACLMLVTLKSVPPQTWQKETDFLCFLYTATSYIDFYLQESVINPIPPIIIIIIIIIKRRSGINPIPPTVIDRD